MQNYGSLDSIEPAKLIVEKDLSTLDASLLSEIDHTVKKYADNLLHAIESVSARLSQLETRSRQIEAFVDELKLSVDNNHGNADGKLRLVENILREDPSLITVELIYSYAYRFLVPADFYTNLRNFALFLFPPPLSQAHPPLPSVNPSQAQPPLRQGPGFFGAYGPSTGPGESHPYSGSAVQYDSGSSLKSQQLASPVMGQSGGSGYPQLPTARILPQALPTASAVSSGSSSPRTGNRVPIDDVVDKVTSMENPRDQVKSNCAETDREWTVS
ncbi:hypothetical protein RND71_039574 [Anisodus tanguticus]|uniref:Uncharacterized protein n=1 Tax=Anisodus tanguticus TaxID=243964 RepID=A0AAE1QXN2_9SOLA|nr:hypothetical protein RND71_039574 [Anisodus tanguticus]